MAVVIRGRFAGASSFQSTRRRRPSSSATVWRRLAPAWRGGWRGDRVRAPAGGAAAGAGRHWTLRVGAALAGLAPRSLSWEPVGVGARAGAGAGRRAGRLEPRRGGEPTAARGAGGAGLRGTLLPVSPIAAPPGAHPTRHRRGH